MPIQTVQEAQAIENKIAIRIDKLEREIDEVGKTAAADFTAIAEGAEVQPGVLAQLSAQLHVLREAQESAANAVMKARRMTAARAVVDRVDSALPLLAEREALGREAAVAIEALADTLIKLGENGRALLPAVRRGRGVETATNKGFVVFDASVLHTEHLQRLVNIHLMKRVLGWRYDEAPPHFFTFDQGVIGANGELRQEVGLLLEAVSPNDIAEIRAHQLQHIQEA